MKDIYSNYSVSVDKMLHIHMQFISSVAAAARI